MRPILQIHRTVFGRQMPMYVVLAFLLVPVYKTAHATMHEIRGFENLQTITPLDFKGNAPPNDPHAAATGVFVDIQSVVFDSQVGTGERLVLADPDNPDNRVAQWVFKEVQIDYKSVTWETVFSKTGSWWRDRSVDGELLQHEKGHINLAEILARKLNALGKISVQELNKQAKPRIRFRDTGLTADEAKAEAERMLKKEAKVGLRTLLLRTVGAAALEEYNRDQNKARPEDPTSKEGRYDEETGHGTKRAAQNAWDEKFKDALTPQPAGSEILRSRSSDSIQFDAAAKSLSFTEDFIIGSGDGPSGDSLIGAGLRLPSFVLQGTTSWGDPLFAAQDNQEMSLSTDSTTHLMGRLPYLIYTDNTFHGVNSLTTLMQTDSAWIEQQRLFAESGEPFLIGIHLTPDENFRVLTTDFTRDGETSFSNLIFPTQVVSEPSSLPMIVLGLVCLLGLSKAWNAGVGMPGSATGRTRAGQRGHPLATPVNRHKQNPTTEVVFPSLPNLFSQPLSSPHTWFSIIGCVVAHQSPIRIKAYAPCGAWPLARQPQKTCCSPPCPNKAISQAGRTDPWLCTSAIPAPCGSRCGRNKLLVNPGGIGMRRAIRSHGFTYPLATLPQPSHKTFPYPKALATSKGLPSFMTW